MRLKSALLVCSCLVAGCATQQNKTLTAQLHGALDMVAVTVDPAYQYATTACGVRDTQLSDALERAHDADAQPHVFAKTKAELDKLRDTCARTTQTFESIRTSHEEAIRLLDEGYPERAEVLLNQIKSSLEMLKGF